VSPAAVRYIKLGQGGRWADLCLARGEMRFGHAAVPHEVALQGREAVRAHLIGLGTHPIKAADFAREVCEFYGLGADCLWVTAHRGELWWAFAEPEVSWLGGDGGAHGARLRKVIGSWRNTDRFGRPLRLDAMSTRLTQTMSYRQTLCGIDGADYLLRKLNGEEEPILARAGKAREEMVEAASAMIEALHWADFETLVDLLFARSGWRRTSALGGTLKDADLIVEQTVTGEIATVQVKSKATQAVLDDYIARFEADATFTRLFFVCHTPRGALDAGDRPDVHVWTLETLAERAIGSGCYDWLAARVA
jgi:hypothetical protein